MRITQAYRDKCRLDLERSGLEVVVHPGRAVLREQGQPFKVEIAFSGKAKTVGQLADSVGRVCVSGEIPPQIDLTAYLIALALHLVSEPAAASERVPDADSRPRSGRPVNRDFYMQIVELDNRLKRQDNPTPAVRIAELMSAGGDVVEPEQVRLWIHRGRKYLDEQGDQ